jgi:hypothetical protein
MIRTLAAIALSSALVLPLAHADTLACNFKGDDGATAQVNFTRAADGGVSATLNVNGEAVPAVAPCMHWTHGNPVSSGVRCPFGKGSMRIETYPTFGNKPGVRVIQWYGNELAGTMQSSDCK